MDDDIAGVDKNPITLRATFRLRQNTERFKLLNDMLGHSVNQSGGAARGNDHSICDGSFADEVNCDNVQGLIVLERGLDTFDHLLQVDRSMW